VFQTIMRTIVVCGVCVGLKKGRTWAGAASNVTIPVCVNYNPPTLLPSWVEITISSAA
jgi:hypothetical protein